MKCHGECQSDGGPCGHVMRVEVGGVPTRPLVCTRDQGHAGEHVACAPPHHAIAEWHRCPNGENDHGPDYDETIEEEAERLTTPKIPERTIEETRAAIAEAADRVADACAAVDRIPEIRSGPCRFCHVPVTRAVCGMTDDVDGQRYRCSRQKGHTGDHVACGGEGRHGMHAWAAVAAWVAQTTIGTAEELVVPDADAVVTRGCETCDRIRNELASLGHERALVQAERRQGRTLDVAVDIALDEERDRLSYWRERAYAAEQRARLPGDVTVTDLLAAVRRYSSQTSVFTHSEACFFGDRLQPCTCGAALLNRLCGHATWAQTTGKVSPKDTPAETRALELLSIIVTNAETGPDPRMGGTTDVALVPLDDIEEAQRLLRAVEGAEGEEQGART